MKVRLCRSLLGWSGGDGRKRRTGSIHLYGASPQVEVRESGHAGPGGALTTMANGATLSTSRCNKGLPTLLASQFPRRLLGTTPQGMWRRLLLTRSRRRSGALHARVVVGMDNRCAWFSSSNKYFRASRNVGKG